MGNEILVIFICLKTQCAFRRQPLFWEPTTVRVTSDYALSSPKEKEKVWSQVSVHLSFCHQWRGKLSAGFDYFSANRRKTAPTFSSRSVGFPNFLGHHRVNNHSYYFMKCYLWVSNSLSKSESTNAFTFWHLCVGLLTLRPIMADLSTFTLSVRP